MTLLGTTVRTQDWNWDFQGFASKGPIFEDDLYFLKILRGWKLSNNIHKMYDFKHTARSYENLRDNPEFSDVTLVCEERQFETH